MPTTSVQLLLLAGFLGGGEVSYEQAFKATQADGQPLLVLVGAEWCPGCRTMKHGVLANMHASGQLAGANYAIVDADEQPELSGQLMRGGTIPQLIVFARNTDGRWRREQITGATSPSDVAALIDRATGWRQQAQLVDPAISRK